MAIGGISFGNSEGDELEVTMRGDAEAIIRVLCTGLPVEDLKVVAAALQVELENRREAAAVEKELP